MDLFLDFVLNEYVVIESQLLLELKMPATETINH